MHGQSTPSNADVQGGLSGDRRTTLGRATAGYDAAFERALVDAITAAVIAASHTTDANCIALRTAETTSALVTVLAGILAMSPAAAAARSPSAGLSMNSASCCPAASPPPQACPDVAAFLRRCFRDDDIGGHA